MDQAEEDQEQTVCHYGRNDWAPGKTRDSDQQSESDIPVGGAQPDDQALSASRTTQGVSDEETQFARQYHGRKRSPPDRKNCFEFNDCNKKQRNTARGFGDNFDRFQQP